MDTAWHDGSGHDRFLDQFDWDGGDWLYRHRMTGPAYRVADAEKDAFVAAFDRYEKRWTWIAWTVFAAIMLTLIFLPPVQMPSPGGIWKGIWSFAGSLLLLAAFATRHIADRFAFRSPTRLLRQRVPVSPALSKAERRERALERVEGKHLFAGGILAALMLVLFFIFGWPATVVGWTMMLFVVGLVMWTAVQGTRKWLLSRRDYAASNLI
jgi:hypothetical protein